MKRKLFKMLLTASVALMLMAGATPLGNAFYDVAGVQVQTQAASSVSFDETTGTLTLKGSVVKEEVQAYADNEAVKTVFAEKGSVFPEDCKTMFAGLKAKKIDLANADMSGVKDMNGMFYCCRALEEVNLKNINTANVETMEWMFFGCKVLDNLDLSSFNTSKVTNMDMMFWDCNSLKNLDISSFDTSSVTRMSSMFANCYNLEELDMRKFDTSNVTFMGTMFINCSSLKTILVLKNWATDQLENGSNMFAMCTSLVGGNGTAYDENHVDATYARIDKDGEPGYFTALESSVSFDETTGTLTLRGNVVKEEVQAYANNDAVKTVYAEEGTVFPEDSSSMFVSFDANSIDLSNVDTSNVTTMASMFWGCENLSKVNVSGFNTSKVTDMSGMFGAWNKLQELDVSGFDTSKVTTMQQMFYGSTSLSKLDVRNFDTSNVTNMFAMFNYCYALSELDLSSFDTSKVQGVGFMFYNCQKLKTIWVSSKWNMDSVVEGYGTNIMFKDCLALVGGNGTTYDETQIGVTYARIDKDGEPGYFTARVGEGNGVVYSASASFSGMIELNFYCEMSSEILADEKAYVTMTAPGAKTVKVLVKDAKNKTISGHKTKFFSYPLVAKQMRDDVIFCLYNGNGDEIPLKSGSGVDYGTSGCPMSIYNYCNLVIKNSTDAKMVALAKAMIDYGTTAQLYFGYNATGLSASNRVKNLDKQVVIDECAHTITGDKPAGFDRFESISLIVESSTALRIYFKYEDNVGPGRFSYKVDDVKKTMTKTSAGKCYLEILGIAAKDLDQPHTFMITNGKKTMTLEASALSYAVLLCKQEKNKPVNFGKALYLYNKAAKEYFKK